MALLQKRESARNKGISAAKGGNLRGMTHCHTCPSAPNFFRVPGIVRRKYSRDSVHLGRSMTCDVVKTTFPSPDYGSHSAPVTTSSRTCELVVPTAMAVEPRSSCCVARASHPRGPAKRSLGSGPRQCSGNGADNIGAGHLVAVPLVEGSRNSEPAYVQSESSIRLDQ